MNSERFLSPRLVGARFDDHSIPLELLKDLAVLEEMIVEVAKAEYLKDNPDRIRSPRGFTEGISLKLADVEGGSAVPVITLVVAAAPLLFPPDNQAYFEKARESVVRAILAAEQNQPITEHLPEKTLIYFDRLGRSLRDGEAIEFTSTNGRPPARLTKETRRTLVLASKAKEVTEEISVRGSIPEADQLDMTFEVQLIDGHKITGPIPSQHFDTIIEAFNGYKAGARVLLQGVGRFNRNERLQSFDSIEHISILDQLDIFARIDELRLIRNGWLEGRGKAPTHDGLEWLSEVFDQHYPDELPPPYLYPTEEGGVRAEWSIDPNEITLDLDLQNHVGFWHSLNLENDQENDRELNLDDPEHWNWLNDQITTLKGGLE